MPTYYEILRVTATATTAEIEQAYETQYHHWRRLVTHHNPETASRANQALQWLEKIRGTLTDPTRRALYDTSIGVVEKVGHLADPLATLLPPSAQEISSDPSLPGNSPMELAWICSRCQTPNPIATLFCKECGYQIGQACVKCGAIIEITAYFCQGCGVRLSDAVRESEIEQAHQIQAERELGRQIAEERVRREEERRKFEELKKSMTIAGCLIGAVTAGIAWSIIWPYSISIPWCALLQLALGATGGGIASNLTMEVLKSPNYSDTRFILAFLASILGGILALPVLVLGVFFGPAIADRRS
ncbi:MAG: zinc ribbon domain-containing protein [Anaerolineae bacterium]|nr:zinc ribbon domain-containing protein [Anaerolineae bacterium]